MNLTLLPWVTLYGVVKRLECACNTEETFLQDFLEILKLLFRISKNLDERFSYCLVIVVQNYRDIDITNQQSQKG